ncbi:MAG: tetratricopeptide repeat protein [Candidatus Krumholzibacteriia bacterium]
MTMLRARFANGLALVAAAGLGPVAPLSAARDADRPAPPAISRPVAGAPAAADGELVSWGQESWRLEPGETFQFTVTFAQIPVRAWRLVVEGDHVLSDLLIRRVADGSLLYSDRNESRHDVPIPWGRGESIAVALSPGRSGGGLYTVTFLGPPPEGLPTSFSYRVNRALEAFAAGQRAQARRLCEQALAEDPQDEDATALLAAFRRDDRLAVAEARLVAGDAAGALARCDSLLAGDQGLPDWAHARLQIWRGEALQALGRPYEALDAYTLGLARSATPRERAEAHLRLGRLFRGLDNPAQAREAFGLARREGLPADLDAEAAQALAELGPPAPGKD